MQFHNPDTASAYSAIHTRLGEIHSPYNDSWTSSSCKKELYLLKCWLEDEYCKLPTFVGEEIWAQERLVEILKK